jgi:uncharacterized protein (TIGR00297 family)
MMVIGRSQGLNLRWQSRLLLALVVLAVAASVLIQTVEFLRFAPALIIKGIAIGASLGLLVWSLRAATPGAALTGALFTVALYDAAPGWRSLLWPLLALFVLTFAATRFGRRRKEELQVAEERRGRSASQVAANLGAAALATIPVSASHFASIPGRPMLIALIAALAEATADTMSSELGEVLGGEPLLLTTLQRVPAGTDGAISLAGTLAGCAGAAAIALLAVVVLPMSWLEGLAALFAAVFGLFVDSLLGATLERKGWLNNDAVNFLSTIAAAMSGAVLAAAIGWRQ